MRARLLIAPALALLCSCATPPSRAPSPGPATAWERLPGWRADHIAAALPALLKVCARLALAPPDQRLGGSGATVTRAADWGHACAAARATPPDDEAAARALLQQHFTLRPLTDAARPNGLFTGYFEPELPASREKSRRFPVAVMTRPADLEEQTGPDGARRFGRVLDGAFVPYYTRAEIDAGALRRQRLDLLYLRSPVDLFFLQLQGSGRLILPHGQVVRVGYAAGNGQAYVPIGRVLADRGDIAPADISADSIRAWLQDHPNDARATMELNPSYTFFREVPGLAPDAGPLGTLGVPLEPLRSVAVDPRQIPLGAPLWIDTATPDGKPLRRLMIAADTGTAVAGVIRADVFFGWGQEAATAAAHMNAPGRAWLLVPVP